MSNLFNNIKPLTNNLFSNQNNPRNPTTLNTEEKKTETQELPGEEEPPHHYITMTDNTQAQPQVGQESEDIQPLKGGESDVEIAKKLSAIVDSANERIKPLLDTMNEVFVLPSPSNHTTISNERQNSSALRPCRSGQSQR